MLKYFLQRKTLISRYLSISKKSVDDLDGPELVVLGDLLCGLTVDDIQSLSNNSALK